MKDEKKAPKLRFKGFTDDWEQVKYGEIFQRRSKMGVSTPALPSVEYDDINPGMGTLNKEPKSKGTSKRGIHFNPGDVLFGKLRPYLKNWLFACFEGVAVGDFWVLTSSKIDHGFTYSLIQAPEFQYIANLSSGSKMPRSDWGLVSNARTFIPTNLSEQKSISSVLFGLDTAITLHEEKKRQLERLKSALLQKMFADKSGYPAVRFKGFDDIWDQEKLNSLVRLHRGLTYSPNNVQDSGIRILRSSNILDGQFVMTDDDIFVKSSVVNIPTVKDGDILITAANGSIKLVGKHAIISGISENTAVSGGFMLVGSSRIPDFVNSLFDTSWYQRFIRKYVTGGNGSIGNLKKNDLDKQYVKVPTTSEQERIGEFFREIDQLIINNQIKHEKLLELKKFLLQNMFI
uniref:HsdS-type I specificity subunit n=2 Tax=Lactobacillus delbrueckii TaxID=1584 RepID=Q50I13_LACDL|nr:HsdS-type I specificity subunit [Lactobacillus delbrueckii subsp. lactis]